MGKGLAVLRHIEVNFYAVHIPEMCDMWAVASCSCGWHTPPTAHSNLLQLFHDSGR
jgi:hypothetical protein